MELRPIPGGIIWANFLNGIDLHGNYSFANQRVGYNLNYSTFSFLGPANPVTGSDVAAGDSTQDIIGARLWWEFLNDIITVGGSLQNGLKRSGNTTYGFDLLISYKRFVIKNEFTVAKRSKNSTDLTKRAIMIQPSYGLTDSLRLVYRYNFMDTEGPNNNREEHILGLNWLPYPILRLRTEYSLINFENKLDVNNEEPDYQKLTTSVVLSF